MTTEDQLQTLLEEQRPTITVVGCGGGGCNTVTRMTEEGIEGAQLCALNTDAQHLLNTDADNRILIGEHTTHGLGAGAKPWVGEEAAEENADEIRDALEGSDMVFITAGLGGGTGTGSAPIVGQIAQDIDALTIAIVTVPFSAEGQLREETANSGLRKLREVVDTVIIVDNDRLLDAAGDVPLQLAFKIADEVLMHSVKGTTELVTTPGLVNLDFADVQTILGSGGMAMIGLGESAGADRTADNEPEMAHDRNSDLDTIDYKELQERAKATGISADQPKDALVNALSERDAERDGEKNAETEANADADAGIPDIGLLFNGYDGEGSGEESRARAAMKDAIRSPLLDVDLEGASGALVNVIGGPEMSIREAESAVELIHDRIDPAARIIWGTSVDDSLTDTVRVLVIVTGVESPQIQSGGVRGTAVNEGTGADENMVSTITSLADQR